MLSKLMGTDFTSLQQQGSSNSLVVTAFKGSDKFRRAGFQEIALTFLELGKDLTRLVTIWKLIQVAYNFGQEGTFWCVSLIFGAGVKIISMVF